MYFKRRNLSSISKISIQRIQLMIEKGMDNEKKIFSGLIKIAEKRIQEIKSGENPH